MTSLFLYILPIFLILSSTSPQMATAGTTEPSTSASRVRFAADLYKNIANERPNENVIFSPASIQSCVALAFFGAEGKTADEIRSGLRLGAGQRTDIAHNYGEFLKTAFKSDSGPDGAQLKMANRIYVNDKLQVAPEFNEIANKYFDSQAEQVNFADSTTAVNKINSWVEQQTQSKIKNLLSASAVNGDTSSVLVNAIYFKAKWEKQFSDTITHKADFAVNGGKQKVSVDMMYLDDRFRFAEVPELDASVLEMPYANSELSMLVVLPNKVDGLPALESKLASVDLNELAARLKLEDVDVFLPKFRIEFEVDVKQPLMKLGMTTMFSDAADFSSLFTTKTPQKISEVRHKAFLDVNEGGSEAAAASYLKIVPMSLNLQQKNFRADHPFFFAIRSSQAVFFAGHLTKF